MASTPILVTGKPNPYTTELLHYKQTEAMHNESTTEFCEQIGRLKMGLDWLEKRLPVSLAERRGMIEPESTTISIRRQCKLFGLTRASYY